MGKTLLLLLFISLHSFGQNSFFIDKKGTKTIVDDNAWDIIVIDKRVSYKLPGKTWEKYIKFEDLDYGIFGPFKIKSYIIEGKKKVLFVQTESNGKSLVSLAIKTESMTDVGPHNTYFQVYVLDNEDKVVDKLDFHDFWNKRDEDKRGQLYGFVKSHFGGCGELMSRLDAVNTHDERNLDILDFLKSPAYVDCK